MAKRDNRKSTGHSKSERLELFNRWMTLKHRIQNLAGVVQNEMKIIPEHIDDFQRLARSFKLEFIALNKDTITYLEKVRDKQK